VRELGKPDPVTRRRLCGWLNYQGDDFAAGATLVDEGKLAWDQSVVELWPDFKLSDPEITPQIRFRNLLNMSSGVPRLDLVWSGAELTAEQTMASLTDLPLLTPPGKPITTITRSWRRRYIAALAAGGQYGTCSRPMPTCCRPASLTDWMSSAQLQMKRFRLSLTTHAP